MKWFVGIKTLDDLRKEYRRLAVLHHPDKGGRVEDMQEINAEYDVFSKKLINRNPDFSEERKVYETQVSEELKEKVDIVINLPGVIVEIIGSWIWVTGKTKEVKTELKEAGFKFSSQKIAWYWHCGYYRKRNGKRFEMDEIRNMWGSSVVEKEEKKSRRTEAIYS